MTHSGPDGSLDSYESWERRQSGSFQLDVSSRHRVEGRMRQMFCSMAPEVQDSSSSSSSDANEHHEADGDVWTGRVDRYRRLMHAHTVQQLGASTVPGYQKTLHAYTLHQLHTHQTHSKSETSSPHIRARQGLLLPSPICAEFGQLTIDNAPIPPANSPTPLQPSSRMSLSGHVRMLPSRGVKPRSTTEPVPRDHALPARERNKIACG